MPIRPENRARYPKDWPVRSRFVRFVRARGRCEWCGVEHLAVVLRSTWRRVAGPFPSPDSAREWIAQAHAGDFGCQSDAPVPWTTVVLTTAHVFDDRPEAASLLNLAALCQKCHNAHDAAARRARLRERRRAHTADLFA